MSPLLLLALVACEPREVCFGDCVDLGYDPGEYAGVFSARIVGQNVWHCEGDVFLEVDDAGELSGDLSCDVWDELSGPLTGYVADRSVSGVWVASADIFYEPYTWQIPIHGTNVDESIHATFEDDSDRIDFERGVLAASIR